MQQSKYEIECCISTMSSSNTRNAYSTKTICLKWDQIPKSYVNWGKCAALLRKFHSKTVLTSVKTKVYLCSFLQVHWDYEMDFIDFSIFSSFCNIFFRTNSFITRGHAYHDYTCKQTTAPDVDLELCSGVSLTISVAGINSPEICSIFYVTVQVILQVC